MGKGVDLRIKEKCMKCQKNVDKHGSYDVEYEHIIKSW